MPYRIAVQEEEKIITLQHEPASSVAEHEASREELIRAAHTSGFRRILVNICEAPPGYSTAQYFDLGRSLAEELPLGTRFAVVLPKEIIDDPDQTLVVNAANNRGLLLKHFTTRQDAMDWLNP